MIVEQNYALWQECKLANTAVREPDDLSRATEDVAMQLDQLTRSDQALVAGLHDVVGRLLAPTGYEGFAPLQKAKLRKYADELDQVAAWFCDQRTLDLTARDAIDMPDLGESVAKARDSVVAGAKWTRGAWHRTPTDSGIARTTRKNCLREKLQTSLTLDRRSVSELVADQRR